MQTGSLAQKGSDLSEELPEITSEKEPAVAEYKATSKDNELEKAAEDQDVKYKAKESKEIDKTAAELTSDCAGAQVELDAVLEVTAASLAWTPPSSQPCSSHSSSSRRLSTSRRSPCS